ncbi:MAG: hypothetical protein Q4G48_04220 [Bacteroidia bacterium]|nr:hypothetical protein [Bacteroidia bacterium]
MKKLVLSAFIAIATIAGLSAQQAGYDPVKAPFGHGEDSVACRMNLSLMATSAKAENYKEALKPWMEVYENCPAASKNTFIYGPQIFMGLYAAETDAAKKQEYVDKVMEIYDNRMKYFTDEEKGTIIARKAYAYMEMMDDKADTDVIYGWLGEALELMKSDMEPKDAYSYYMAHSLTQFLTDQSKKDQYLNDYFTVTEYVDEAIKKANAANDKANADYLELVKDVIVKGFVGSGAGDCETLTEYYADQLEPNKANKEFLNEIITALSSVGCTDADLYLTASEYLYQLEPSAAAAIGLANKALRDKDYDAAVKYYSDGAKMETDKDKASSYMMQLAGIFSNQRNFARARQAANEALQYNPNNGSAYILIGQLYATSAGNIFPEAEKRGLVFNAAVDKMQRAKAVDPSVTAEANRYINQYSGYFMDTETAFMMGIKAGESVFIPGWIGESTTVRLR